MFRICRKVSKQISSTLRVRRLFDTWFPRKQQVKFVYCRKNLLYYCYYYYQGQTNRTGRWPYPPPRLSGNIMVEPQAKFVIVTSAACLLVYITQAFGVLVHFWLLLYYISFIMYVLLDTSGQSAKLTDCSLEYAFGVWKCTSATWFHLYPAAGGDDRTMQILRECSFYIFSPLNGVLDSFQIRT
jgi:hypothetical protein